MSSPTLGLYLNTRRSSDASRLSTSPVQAPSPQLSPGNAVRPVSIRSAPPAHWGPARSFIQESVGEGNEPADSAHLAQSVRRDTADLASYALSNRQPRARSGVLGRTSSHSPAVSETSTVGPAKYGSSTPDERHFRRASFSQIAPVFQSPASRAGAAQESPSMLTNLLRDSPSDNASHHDGATAFHDAASRSSSEGDREDLGDGDGGSGARLARESSRLETVPELDEQTPLISNTASKQSSERGGRSLGGGDLEAQGAWQPSALRRLRRQAGSRAAEFAAVLSSPRKWDGRAILRRAVVEPASYLPAVLVGLLLNVLDALSYGMILFPLASPIFSHLGSAGISIFYVSTIVAQITFSSGSIFRGGVGSELIEVVPFFHNMAAKITLRVGKDNPDAVIATTILSYSLSSLLTGLVFYLMGKFKFGYMVGFIPRHILIGCIGGVGFFLIVTGFEVSARLDGGIEYNMETLRKMVHPETLPLWMIPLALAVILFYGQSKIRSKYFLPLYIIAIPVVFYLGVLAINDVEVDGLREDGWIFEGPPAGEPWWYFYTLYKFHLVRWDAVAETIPAMFALTFFGILHVPINVPALALNTGEDDADLNHELKLHGYSNFISGLAGSIQNYLVYANTMFFMRSGGDTRLAGFMLAGFTFLVMTIGPSTIEFIPVMMVGTLIFDLGFELLLEAVWLPRKKLKLGEYVTVVVIVLIMGAYDFVVGIGVGILLAFVTLVVQTARVPAVRAAYSGETLTSTVRRIHSHSQYLHQAGRQIFIVKLSGYLFFGTIVSVEERVRNLISDASFTERPIRFLIIDLWHVAGVDYSAGEAFNRISRILDRKGIILILSGVEGGGKLSRTLRAVGVGRDGVKVTLFPDLNSALESCENELLKTYYASQEALGNTPPGRVSTVVPARPPETRNSPLLTHPAAGPSLLEAHASSPRNALLREAAQRALTDAEVAHNPRWQSFSEPLRLMLQIFQGLSSENEDFWFRATPYFTRRVYSAGTVLYRMGEEARGFYLVEEGLLREEHDLPQGWLCESIVAGTTFGELPFFSETKGTATVTVERDCVVWFLSEEAWGRMQKEERDVAWELLRVSLKLTSEHMALVTSYILSIAG